MAEYENDDDFQFVRKSKKAKTEDEPEPAPVPVPAKKSGRGRPPKDKDRVSKANGASVDTANTMTAAPEETPRAPATATRKSSRRKQSIDASQDDLQHKVPKRATRRSARLSEEIGAEEDEPPQQANGAPRNPGRKKGKASRLPRAAAAAATEAVIEEEEEEEEEEPQPQHEETVESAKIKLPMSDTPIINRNKEMRKKGNTSRRSSLGSRGRRASSLFESGQTAIPHREVNPSEFYKHIEADGLIEPRRMKHLLVWCGERALIEKPPHGTSNSSIILGGTLNPLISTPEQNGGKLVY